jgi:DNA-binding MarR family transcriptional regulator
MKYSQFKVIDESPGLLFWQVSILWQRKIKEALRPYNVTHTQFVILAVTHELNEKDSYVTQNDISNLSMVDVMTVSTTLRLLEKKHFITKEGHPTNTRANVIKNTKLGEDILSKVNPIIESVDKEFFFDNKEDFSKFMDLLKKLEN